MNMIFHSSILHHWSLSLRKRKTVNMIIHGKKVLSNWYIYKIWLQLYSIILVFYSSSTTTFTTCSNMSNLRFSFILVPGFTCSSWLSRTVWQQPWTFQRKKYNSMYYFMLHLAILFSCLSNVIFQKLIF